MSFGLSTELEFLLAHKIKKHFTSIDKIRFVSSGTEACMSAIRVARAFSGRSKIIKFDGCYHGHFDGLLVKSGSGNLTLGIPSGKGILKAYTKDTISIPFNDIKAFEDAIVKNKDSVACVIVEPVACNAGIMLAQKGFLETLREVTKKHNIVLIFDEVITGFRLSLEGAQKIFNIKPDLTCLGKIIGGGFAVGAFGGRDDIMSLLAPQGEVYQAGTLSGNPVAVAAGLETLKVLSENKDLYKSLNEKRAVLTSGIKEAADEHNIALTINSIGSIFSIFFTKNNVVNYSDVLSADKNRYAQLFNLLLNEGILLAPSAYETAFLSSAHSDTDIKNTITAFRKCFSQLHNRGE